MGVIYIRQARPSDAEAIIAGINFICAEGGAFYTTHFVPSPTWDIVLYRPQERPSHLLAVAEWEGDFAAMGRLFPGPSHSYTQHVIELGMFVLPPYRQQGVGRTLLNWLLGWARHQAYEKVTLAVFANNLPAYRLYKATGFVEEGRQLQQVKVGDVYIDLVLMAYWL